MSQGFRYPPPTDGKPFRLNMGLRSLEPSAWLEEGDDLVSQIPERLDLVQTSRDVVYQELDGYEPVITEAVRILAANLHEYHSEIYNVKEGSVIHIPTTTIVDLTSRDVLLHLASIIGEDLVLLAREDDEWKIVAGAVLFPSRWKLSEKIGKGMDAVHTPVPGFPTALAPFMTATFDKISSERAVWRKNWSLHSTPDLHQPTSIHQPVSPENYWWRTERQTLTRLNCGEYLLFTIRNRAEPLSWIKEDNQAAQLFAETLSSFTPETIEYKGLQRDHQSILDYLRS